MKKYILLVVSAVALAFTSCSDSEDIDINYQTDFIVSAKNVIKPFIEEKEGDFSISDNDDVELKLRITSLIYKEDGEIHSKNEGFVNEYDELFKYTQILPNGNYKIITFSSVVTKDGSVSTWDYKNEEQLSTLTLTQNGFYTESTLGLYEGSIRVDGSSNVNELYLEPATSMVTIRLSRWSELYFKAQTGQYNGYYKDFTFLFTGYNVMSYKNTNEWSYNNNLPLDYYFSLGPIDIDYYIEEYEKQGLDFDEDLYGHLPLIPCVSSYACNRTILFNNGTIVTGSVPQTGQINMEKGKQYVLTLDCVEQTFELKEVSKTDRSSRTKSSSCKQIKSIFSIK